jgi:hypothetical protein
VQEWYDKTYLYKVHEWLDKTHLCRNDSIVFHNNIIPWLTYLVVFRRPTFYIVSALNNKTIDINEQGGAGDWVTMKTLQTGKISQKWYFDENGYIRSAINNYAIDISKRFIASMSV